MSMELPEILRVQIPAVSAARGTEEQDEYGRYVPGMLYSALDAAAAGYVPGCTADITGTGHAVFDEPDGDTWRYDIPREGLDVLHALEEGRAVQAATIELRRMMRDPG